MNRKFLTLALAAFALSYAPIAFSQTQTQDKPVSTTDKTTAEQSVDKAKADVAAAKEKVDAKIESEVESQTAPSVVKTVSAATPAPNPAAAPTPVVATPAPEASSATAEVEALKTIFLERRKLNYNKVKLDFAKEKALNENSDFLNQQTDALYDSAVQNLNSNLGNVSDPQAQETYFEYDEDADTGEFVIVQIRDSYVKAERGDVCQVSTRIHLITSLDKELPTETSAESTVSTPTTPAPATAVVSTSMTTEPNAVVTDPNAPQTESYTEIKCYNDKRTTYHQLLVK